MTIDQKIECYQCIYVHGANITIYGVFCFTFSLNFDFYVYLLFCLKHTYPNN